MNTEEVLKTKQPAFDHKFWYSKQSCTIRIQALDTISHISARLFPSFFPLLPFFFSHQLLTQIRFKWCLLQACHSSWKMVLLHLEVMNAAHRMTAACSQVPGSFPPQDYNLCRWLLGMLLCHSSSIQGAFILTWSYTDFSEIYLCNSGSHKGNAPVSSSALSGRTCYCGSFSLFRKCYWVSHNSLSSFLQSSFAQKKYFLKLLLHS